MRQGSRYAIIIQRRSAAPNEYGTEVEIWADLVRLRAQVVERKALTEAREEAGTVGRELVTFRTRIFGGVELSDRVIFGGRVYELRELRGGDFPEARGLELVCEGTA